MNREIWLWLMLVMQPHNAKTMQIVELYGDVRTAAEAIRDGKCDALDKAESERADRIRSRDVQQMIEECDANGIRIVTIEDDEYPELLRSVFSPPVVLFVQGTLCGLSDAPALAVVGAREASRYSVNTARAMCSELAKVGMVLVSGLAVGIDTIAHQCALDSGVPTIGVLACGNLVDYPVASRALKQRIIAGGGAVISELPPHSGVDPDYFCHRNRIISGLAQGTFIVEAGERSGCHHTAEHAIQQGRELFCLPPHEVMNPKYTGVVRYLRDGATPVFSHIDIIDAYKFSLFMDDEE